jgi:hypothetical protein
MSSPQAYRTKAAELKARAAKESHRQLADDLDHLARCYLRLAEQADQNRSQDLWIEIGPKPRLQGEGT